MPSLSPVADVALAAAVSGAVLTVLVIHPSGRRLLHPRRQAGPDDLRNTNSWIVEHGRSRWQRCRNRWSTGRLDRRAVSAAAVAEWCDALARSLRSGTALRTALVDTVPSDPPLAQRSERLRQSIERGATVEDAVARLDLGDVARRVRPSSHLALAGAVLAISGAVGGPAAVSLDRLATALRLRVADGQERSAHSAQARLSAHVLTVVPLGLLGLLAATDSDVRGVLGSGLGLALLGIGLLLNAAGWWWMHRIIENGQ